MALQTAAQRFIKGEMDQYKQGALHSGSKTGPVVRNPRQAIAISLSQAKKKGLQ